MPRTISAGLASHIAGSVTTLAALWKITRVDSTVHYFTDHDKDIVFEGQTYKAAQGFRRSALAQDASLAVDNLEVAGIFDAAEITEADLRGGKFDYADVRLMIVNWADLTQGALKLRRGWLGEAVITPKGYFKTELRGLLQAYQQPFGELISLHCRADLGDGDCRFPIAPAEVQRSTAYAVGDYVRVNLLAGSSPPLSPPVTGEESYLDLVFRCSVAGTTAATVPAYSQTISGITIDGTATFVTENALNRLATVGSVIDRRNFTLIELGDTVAYPENWFNLGAVKFLDGANVGVTREVKDWAQGSPGQKVTLFLGAPFTIAVGDRIRIYPGCDKRVETCRDKFDNVVNFRGEPHVPGTDYVATYPDAR